MYQHVDWGSSQIFENRELEVLKLSEGFGVKRKKIFHSGWLKNEVWNMQWKNLNKYNFFIGQDTTSFTGKSH